MMLLRDVHGRKSSTQYTDRGITRCISTSQLHQPASWLPVTVDAPVRRRWRSVVVLDRGRQDHTTSCRRWRNRPAANSWQRSNHHGCQPATQWNFCLYARRPHHRSSSSLCPASVSSLLLLSTFFCDMSSNVNAHRRSEMNRTERNRASWWWPSWTNYMYISWVEFSSVQIGGMRW